MTFKCIIGLHRWDGCKCLNCDKIREEQHDWSKNCENCVKCGKALSKRHDFSKDCEKCSICGYVRLNHHDWSEDCAKCANCGKQSDLKHVWEGHICLKCRLTPQIILERGIEKGNQKDYEGSIQEFTMVIEIDPTFHDAFSNRALSKWMLYSYDEALSDANKAIDIDPNDANAYNTRGMAKHYLLDYLGAINDYSTAIKMNPNHPNATTNLEIALEDKSNKEGTHIQKSDSLQTDKQNLSQIKSDLAKNNGLLDTINFDGLKIGNQIWGQRNLDTSTFANGETIPEAKTEADWMDAANSGKPVWCYYNYDTINGKVYGKLYNWYAANDPRGLAPKGWHVATVNEWKVLLNHLGGEEIAGTKLKSTSGWQENHGTNSSGFSALPGGARISGSNFEFDGVCYIAQWWGICTKEDDNDDWTLQVMHSDGWIDSGYGGYSIKSYGHSVRCVKN